MTLLVVAALAVLALILLVGIVKGGGDDVACVTARSCSGDQVCAKGVCAPPPVSAQRASSSRYYSYARTVLEGGVMPALMCEKCGPEGERVWGQMFVEAGDPAADDGSPLFQIQYGPWAGRTFVDWDASSGVMCGNSWGMPSKQAEVCYNLMSLSAPHPVIQDRAIFTKLVQTLFYGPDGKSAPFGDAAWQNNMQTNSSACLGVTPAELLWDAGSVYLGGWMANWYYTTDWDTVCQWCHYGATYGYTSLTQFFVGASHEWKGILAGRDIAFSVASNADSLAGANGGDAQAPYDAFLEAFGKLARKGFQNVAAFRAGVKSSLASAYAQLATYPGLTATVGYFYLDSKGAAQQGSSTISVIDGKVQVPKYDYPFSAGGGQVQYLGAEKSWGREPAYYFGSGTKPLTAALTIQALVTAWKDENADLIRDHTAEEVADYFLQWYLGAGLVTNPSVKKKKGGVEFLSTYGAATMGAVLQLQRQSFYHETVLRWDLPPPRTPADFHQLGDPALQPKEPRGVPHVGLIQEWWLTLYGPDACSWRGLSQSYCPTFQCLEIDWTNPESGGEPARQACACLPMPPDDLQDNFLNHLSPVALSCMQGGVPDADSVLVANAGLLPGDISPMDFIDQAVERTAMIGPMGFLREAVGFNWLPGYTSALNPRATGYLENLPIEPGQYTSSGFTLLGSILWILDPKGPATPEKAKDWSMIDINASFLPPALRTNLNFGGTVGNGGAAYFVDGGGVPQADVQVGCNVALGRRSACGGQAAQASLETCTADPGCCYSPTFVQGQRGRIPWCYRRST